MKKLDALVQFTEADARGLRGRGTRRMPPKPERGLKRAKLPRVTDLTREQIEERYAAQKKVSHMVKAYSKYVTKRDPVTNMPRRVSRGGPTLEFAREFCAFIGAGKTTSAFVRMRAERGQTRPSYSTILQWQKKHAWFRERVERAVEARVEIMADELLEIADDTANDYKEDKDGNERFNAEAVQRAKLRIDTRKFIMGKLNARKWGEQKDMADMASGPLVIIWGNAQEIARPDQLRTINKTQPAAIEGEYSNASNSDTIHTASSNAAVPRPDAPEGVSGGASPVRQDDGDGKRPPAWSPVMQTGSSEVRIHRPDVEDGERRGVGHAEEDRPAVESSRRDV